MWGSVVTCATCATTTIMSATDSDTNSSSIRRDSQLHLPLWSSHQTNKIAWVLIRANDLYIDSKMLRETRLNALVWTTSARYYENGGIAWQSRPQALSSRPGFFTLDNLSLEAERWKLPQVSWSTPSKLVSSLRLCCGVPGLHEPLV